MAVRRRFVRVGDRRVHYRVAGAGPAIVMLHDSPRSSRLHVDVMRRLAPCFRVYALDTPGYGNSSPIDIAKSTIADFAGLLGETLDALGLSHAPLYATHTSATIALEYSAAAPKPPAIVLLDGLSIPQQAPDEAFITAYMRPFRIDTTGAYLAAEWSRMQDMLRWFPWFDAQPANRIAMDRPSEAWIDDYMIDLLSAGPHYSDAYAAALRYDPRDALRRTICPTVVGARSDDVLFASLDLLPADSSESVRVARLSADRDVWLAWIAKTLGGHAAPIPEPASAYDQEGAVYVDLPHGQMLVHRAGPAGREPLLIVEAPTTLHARLWQAELARDRATLVPELPGYGESDPLVAGASLDDHADILAAAVRGLAIDRIDVLAIGAATPLAMALAHRHPAFVRWLALDGVAPPAEPGTADRLHPKIVPDHAGGHLHRIWHMLRGGEMQWPWHDGSIAAQRKLAPCLAAEPLHRALLDVLKQPATYGDTARAALAHDPACMPLPSQRMLLFAMADDPGYAGVAELAAQAPNASVIPRPSGIASAAAAFREASGSMVIGASLDR